MQIPDPFSKSPSPQKTSHPSKSDRGYTIVFAILATVMFALLALPGLALIWRAVDYISSDYLMELAPLLSSLSLSLSTTLVSVLIIILLGTPTAYLLARTEFRFKRLLAIFVELPIVMPPVVAGLALLAAFGRRGLLGPTLQLFDLQLSFTPAAVILAQVFVASPFYIRTAQNRFNAIPQELEEAARMDGASAWTIFWAILLPLSGKALLAGLILSWARALGEFGATILFAGNFQGRTQTIPLFIYSALERDLGATYLTAGIMLGLAAVLLALVRMLTRLETGTEWLEKL
ncbi:MAG TPA: ABC transporter permease [Anaerolineales bacterium]|nr:ABC transporter permease [Anaerolineales bacterium]